jgi:alpha-1,6-mannosyltransferase
LRNAAGVPFAFWLGFACWLAGTVGLLVAWWRLKSAPDARWLVWTGVLWALPLLAAPPLASRDVYSYACQGWLYAAGPDPYEVGAATCPWVDAVAPLWRDTPAPYGPAAIGLSAVAARVAVAAVDHPADQLVLAVGLLRLCRCRLRSRRSRPGQPHRPVPR